MPRCPCKGCHTGRAGRAGGSQRDTGSEERGWPCPAAPDPAELSSPSSPSLQLGHAGHCTARAVSGPEQLLVLPELRAHSRPISDGNLLSQRLQDWQRLQQLPEQAASCKCMSASAAPAAPERMCWAPVPWPWVRERWESSSGIAEGRAWQCQPGAGSVLTTLAGSSECARGDRGELSRLAATTPRCCSGLAEVQNPRRKQRPGLSARCPGLGKHLSSSSSTGCPCAP